MDGKQRAEMDETLEGFEREAMREKRVAYVRSLAGGEVVMAGGN